MNNGILGEAKVLTYFVENGYNVYTPFDGHSPFDLVVYKDNVLQRVSVKSTQKRSYRRWSVSVGQKYRNTKDGIVKHVCTKFDNTSCDLVAIYIIPEDRIVIIDAKTIGAVTTYSIIAS